MAKTTKRSALEEQMKAIQAELVEVKIKEETKAGKLARKSGLLDLDLTEAQLLEGFKELTAKFRGSSVPATPADGASAA